MIGNINCKSHISDNDYLTLIGLRGRWDPHGGVCFGYFLSEVFEALWRRDILMKLFDSALWQRCTLCVNGPGQCVEI